jgi:16S rRNA (guanine527-N7)-methyltransferase
MGIEKSTGFSDAMSLLAETAAAFKIHLSSSEIHLFRVYLLELWEWNMRFNLTGLKTRERMVIELFLDSLIPAPFLPEEGSMLDAGSGAGFPGVPLKIINPRLDTWLLETNGRRVRFLKQIVRSLNLQGLRVIQGRVESPGEWACVKGFHVITARALADLRQIVLWCSPLLRQDGFLVAFMGAEGERIMEQNKQILAGRGLWVDKHLPYLLPGKKTKRHTFILKKHET